LDKQDYHILKTFLLFLNFMPSIIGRIRGELVTSSEISVDIFIGKKLRDI
jgi:hypothetical protein